MGNKQRIEEQLQLKTTCIELQPGLVVNLNAATREDHQPTRMRYLHESQYIHFNYLLHGHYEAKVRGNVVNLGMDDMNVGYAKDEYFDVVHCSNLSNIEVMVDASLLADMAGEDCALLQHHTEGSFFTHNSRATNRAKMAVTQLYQQMNQAVHSPLLLHACTLNFLHWHLDSLMGHQDQPPISLREQRQLRAARDFLLQDLSSPPTIAEIARQVGLNQLKLKQGFKSLYNSSIYAYFQGERMKQAQLFLATYNVTETAVMLGYSNVSHFSAAFRKQFGMLPSQARQHTEHTIC
jgi:AraC family transcriptional regulator